ncbi:YtxH domain-containing protein [Candidatus Clostridium radicumherbarum]|uniref:YtxH domain-containing protein n=1 Tax=Candidatus Clostridium radicumherbarum TaxID=3381662 RepID=A0ABW8TRU2_9CLOT
MGFIRGITAGAIIGTAAGMLISPQLNKHTRRRLRKSGDMMVGMVGDIYDDLVKKMR